MNRLTIHLNKVDKTFYPKIVKGKEVTISKIHNTLSFPVENESDIAYHLTEHKGNIKKYYLSNDVSFGKQKGKKV